MTAATRTHVAVDWGELARRVRARDLGPYAEGPLEIRCHDLRTTPFREVVDAYLALRRHPGWRWVDAQGAEAAPTRLGPALARLGWEAVTAPAAYLGHWHAVRALRRQPRLDLPGDGLRSALYLRTDQEWGLQAGGSVAHVAGVIAGLRLARVQVEVLAADRLPGVPEDEHFHLVPPSLATRRNIPELPLLEYNAPVIAEAERLCAVRRPEFIYQRYVLHGYAGPSLRRRLRVPLVCEYNGSIPWMARAWEGRTLQFERLALAIERLNLRTADLVVVPSAPLAREAVERAVRPERVLVNPNGVDPVRYRPDAAGAVEVRRTLRLEGKLVVGFIGSFGAWHGAEPLVEAAARLLAEPSPASEAPLHFLLVGDGLRLPAVRERVRALGLEERVTLTGMVPQERGPAFLAACDILASPHVPNPDGSAFFGSPTKLFEYMATGRPIVASALGQIGEVLAPGETGLLVPPGDVAALAAAIGRLAADAALRERLGRAARATAVARHTWDAHARRIVEALEAALSVRAAAREPAFAGAAGAGAPQGEPHGGRT